MTEDQQCIALAVALGGWTEHAAVVLGSVPEERLFMHENGNGAVYPPRAYCGTLPALTLDWLHELKLKLTNEEWMRYADALWRVVGNPASSMQGYDNAAVQRFMRAADQADAKSQAKALLRAIGKWDGGQAV